MNCNDDIRICVRLGLFTVWAYDILRIVVEKYLPMSPDSEIQINDIQMMLNGEVVLNSGCYQLYKSHASRYEERETFIRKRLAKGVRIAAMIVEESEDPKIWLNSYEDDISEVVTAVKLNLLADMIEKGVEEYIKVEKMSKDVEDIIGYELDPFKQAALDELEKKRAEIQNKFDADLLALKNKYGKDREDLQEKLIKDVDDVEKEMMDIKRGM